MCLKEECSGLTSIEDSVNAIIKLLEENKEKRTKNDFTTGNNLNVSIKTNSNRMKSKKHWWKKKLMDIFFVSNRGDCKKHVLDMCKKVYPLERNWISFNTTQINIIRSHHFKEKIENTQQNNKCRLWGDGEDTVNCKMFECCKLVKKEYETMHDRLHNLI